MRDAIASLPDIWPAFGFIVVWISGETDYNKKRIIQGQMDTELAVKGVRQAELCGQRLQHERFTHAYASDLKRALVTGENILKYNHITKCTLIKDVRLRERNFGEYEGRPCDEFMALLKKSNVKHIQDFAPPKGESLKQVRERAVDWFKEVCQQVRDLWKVEIAKLSYDTNNVVRHVRGGTNTGALKSESATTNDATPTFGSRNSYSLDETDLATSTSAQSTTPRRRTGSTGAAPWIPDVLVVSHGGFLKELIAYFCEELGAVLPGGMKAMSKTPYNTAVSKFSVSLNEDGQAHMTCLVINDREHLLNADLTAVKADDM